MKNVIDYCSKKHVMVLKLPVYFDRIIVLKTNATANQLKSRISHVRVQSTNALCLIESPFFDVFPSQMAIQIYSFCVHSETFADQHL